MPEHRPYLSVVIPVLNEQGCIDSCIDRLRAELDLVAASWEIVVVDDGSTDRTRTIVESQARADGRVRLLGGPHEGKGAALRRGVLAATGTWRFMADADLAMPPDNLSRFLELTRRERPPQIIIGSREAPGAQRVGESAFRHVAGRVFNWAVRVVAGGRIMDTQCGFKLFSAAAAEHLFPRLTISGFAFDVELLHLARQAGFDIREVGIVWHGRSDSRVGLGRGATAFCDILRIRWRHGQASRRGGSARMSGGLWFLGLLVLLLARFVAVPEDQMLTRPLVPSSAGWYGEGSGPLCNTGPGTAVLPVRACTVWS